MSSDPKPAGSKVCSHGRERCLACAVDALETYANDAKKSADELRLKNLELKGSIAEMSMTLSRLSLAMGFGEQPPHVQMMLDTVDVLQMASANGGSPTKVAAQVKAELANSAAENQLLKRQLLEAESGLRKAIDEAAKWRGLTQDLFHALSEHNVDGIAQAMATVRHLLKEDA